MNAQGPSGSRWPSAAVAVGSRLACPLRRRPRHRRGPGAKTTTKSGARTADDRIDGGGRGDVLAIAYVGLRFASPSSGVDLSAGVPPAVPVTDAGTQSDGPAEAAAAAPGPVEYAVATTRAVFRRHRRVR